MTTMKKTFLFMLYMFSITVSAQIIERVDSIDIETGEFFPAEDIQTVDTISCESVLSIKDPIPQVPFEELDSMTMRNFDDRYVVVYKKGKCGIYDLLKEQNVTRIEYSDLWFSFRKEMEGEYYTYFGWDEPDTRGVIGIAESNNQFLSIAMPKKEEDNTKEE